MSSCKLDHSIEDVTNKLVEQAPYMEQSLVDACKKFLSTPATQIELNDLFHLFKKYDLASADERVIRNEKIKKLVG